MNWRARLIAYSVKQAELLDDFGIYVTPDEIEREMEDCIREGIRQFWVEHWKRQMERSVGPIVDPKHYDENENS
jgi:hypothetical protein